jgi:murein DD-endopeptidase MepM/ murein hydrolase activator NlpD
MKSYPIPFPKGTEYKEIKNKLGKDRPPGYRLLSHERFLSTKHAKDLSVKIGTPVLAIEDGVVVSIKNDSDKYINPKTHPRYEILFRKNNMSIEELKRLGDELLEFTGRYTNYVQVNQVDNHIVEYVHLNKNIPVSLKQKIKNGDIVGFVGMTGVTDRPHLHLNLFENRSVPFKLRG